jgi:vacuolar-type H+-ATPase subunit E/Vma4
VGEGVRSIFSKITERIKKGANLETEQKLIELREAVLDPQTGNLELREKIRKMERQRSN